MLTDPSDFVATDCEAGVRVLLLSIHQLVNENRADRLKCIPFCVLWKTLLSKKTEYAAGYRLQHPSHYWNPCVPVQNPDAECRSCAWQSSLEETMADVKFEGDS
jgi:hypothetical protein